MSHKMLFTYDSMRKKTTSMNKFLIKILRNVIVPIREYVYFERDQRIIDDHDELNHHRPIIIIKLIL